LEAPDYVKQEWQNGNKNFMADTLQRVNWDKDSELHLSKHHIMMFGLIFRKLVFTG